ncbi:DUF1285 domain-containing protein [Prosthecomicrobium pneumaticum]|uniref:Proteophosphoglycan n=1 Tax=Prosthecomicrobium pneumaticum TaxID=81895 RepID=A0A7W9L1J4_9HYPH|nr:DUF1285 domain-containing protein [Prosthecomicrobium pneumaticum]MBB5752811.1 hypothetical protein [Prosthecomicrobium pneumaticum]
MAVSALDALAARAAAASGPLPVERWDPACRGAIDIAIDRAGVWWHEGRPIRREGLVRLFSRILRREPDGGYALVTPLERLSIRVANVPLLAVDMAAEGEGADERLVFLTNVGELVAAGPDRPLRFTVEPGRGDLVPYLTVRPGIEARLERALVMPLVERGQVEGGLFGVRSAGVFFAIGAAP